MTKQRFNQNWDELAVKIGYADEKDMLTQMYLDQRMPISEISARLGAAHFAIKRHLNKCGIECRPRGGPNSNAKQTEALFRMDQRVVLFCDLNKLSRITKISRSLCYKYRITITRSKEIYELLHPVTHRGSGTVRNTEQDTLTPAPTGQDPGVS